MSGATDVDTASLWHQMLSRTCWRVMNGGSGRPRHVISTCKHTHFLHFSFSAVSKKKPRLLHRAREKWWCAHDSTLMHVRVLVNCDQINKQDTKWITSEAKYSCFSRASITVTVFKVRRQLQWGEEMDQKHRIASGQRNIVMWWNFLLCATTNMHCNSMADAL